MAEVGQGQEPQAVLDALLAAVDKTAADGVTEQEVDRAKQALLKQIELGASNSARIAIELSEWSAQGDWRLYFLHRDRLEKVTAEDVSRAAKQYLVRNNRTVGLFVPTTQAERAKVPATPDVASLVDDYKGRAAVAVGEAFDVSPANIEARTTRTKTAGGLDVALLPKKTRGEMVSLRLTLRYGSAETLKGQAKACELLPSLMLRGTRQLSRQDLQDKLDRLRIRLVGAGQPGEATFTLRCKREQLPEAIDLLRQVLREPALPDAELDILVREQLAELDQQRTDPQSLATNAVARKLNPYPADDPRASPSVDEETAQFKSLKHADLVRLHRDFLGGTHGQLAIVGDFDPQTTLPACAAFLDGWKAPQPYARMPRRGDFPFPGGAEDIAVPDKESATYFAALLMPVRDDHPDFPALQIGNHILGAGSLSSRLGDRVRQKEGLSYGVASGLNARSLDDRAVFYVYAICNPGNMPKVKTAIREEIDRLLKDGVGKKELEEAVHGYLQNQQVSRTEDASLAKTLEETLFAGRTMKFVADQEKVMSGLSAEQVAAALRKHIDPKRMYVAAAGDFRPSTAGSETKGEPKK
jgi:zinc protease